MELEFLDIANRFGMYSKDQISTVPNEHNNEYRVVAVSINKYMCPEMFEECIRKLKNSSDGMYFIDDYDLGVFLEANSFFSNQYQKHLLYSCCGNLKHDFLEQCQRNFVYLIEISQRF